MHSALKQDQPAAAFTDDHIRILNKIRTAISQGDPFKNTGEDTTKEETESDQEESDFEKDSDWEDQDNAR